MHRVEAMTDSRKLPENDTERPDPPSELEKYRLLSAAGNPDISALQAILDARPDAACWKVSDMDVTGLMIAAREGNLDGIRVLAAAGADFNAQDGHGKTALGWAMQDPDNYRAAKLLKELGARLDIPDYWSKTPEEGFKDMTQIKVLKPLRLKLPKGRSI